MVDETASRFSNGFPRTRSKLVKWYFVWPNSRIKTEIVIDEAIGEIVGGWMGPEQWQEGLLRLRDRFHLLGDIASSQGCDLLLRSGRMPRAVLLGGPGVPMTTGYEWARQDYNRFGELTGGSGVPARWVSLINQLVAKAGFRSKDHLWHPASVNLWPQLFGFLDCCHDRPTIHSEAIESDGGIFRHVLRRFWYPKYFRDAKVIEDRHVLFVMLNPSTAGADKNDPTLVRCIGFAKQFGYDSLSVVNLFDFRSTDPDALFQGCQSKHADRYIDAEVKRSCAVICAWGDANKGFILERALSVMKRLSDRMIPMYHLGLTKNGSPRHPLYLKKDVELTSWVPIK